MASRPVGLIRQVIPISLIYQPYGMPDRYHRPRKQYPNRNLHYVFHDRVLPTDND